MMIVEMMVIEMTMIKNRNYRDRGTCIYFHTCKRKYLARLYPDVMSQGSILFIFLRANIRTRLRDRRAFHQRLCSKTRYSPAPPSRRRVP